MWPAHIRSFVARHRAVYWGAVATLALVVALALGVQSHRLDRARAAWGRSIAVWVAARDVAPGDVVVAQLRVLPEAALPPSALRGAWPSGAIARQRVAAGEVLVRDDLASTRLPLLGAGHRAVAIAVDDGTPALEPGDHVDVIAAGSVVAADGVVVATGPTTVLVAVEPGAAPAAATAAHEGSAVVVLRPPES
jgi:Flp pilus assembly protein CpaB